VFGNGLEAVCKRALKKADRVVPFCPLQVEFREIEIGLADLAVRHVEPPTDGGVASG
jgi:hypothetical protein